VFHKFKKQGVVVYFPNIEQKNKGITSKQIVIDSLATTGIKKGNVAGVVDRDFTILQGKKLVAHEGLFYTDHHDIDVMVLHPSSNALECFVMTFLWDPECVPVAKVRERILHVSCELGLYKLALQDNDIHFSTHKALTDALKRIDNFFNTNCGLDHHKICLAIKKYLPKKKYAAVLLSRRLRSKQHLDPYQLANGHDLVKCLHVLLSRGLYNMKAVGTPFSKLTTGDLERMLLNGYDSKYFKRSELCTDILSYQATPGVKKFLDV
jgi:hypothetical protein